MSRADNTWRGLILELDSGGSTAGKSPSLARLRESTIDAVMRRRLIVGAGDRIDAAQRKLLEHVVLKRGRGDGGCGDDRQRDTHPFAIEEEEQFVAEDRPAQAAAEVVHR